VDAGIGDEQASWWGLCLSGRRRRRLGFLGVRAGHLGVVLKPVALAAVFAFEFTKMDSKAFESHQRSFRT